MAKITQIINSNVRSEGTIQNKVWGVHLSGVQREGFGPVPHGVVLLVEIVSLIVKP